MKVKTNQDHDDLWCTYCKLRIHIGEKFVIVDEAVYGGEVIEKPYHLDPDCTPSEDDLEYE